MKKFLLIILLFFWPTLAIANPYLEFKNTVDKTYSRNELPQLNQEILENSNFNYELKSISRESIIPVQVERVKDLKKQEKRLIKARQTTYRPLVIDQDFYLVDGHHR